MQDFDTLRRKLTCQMTGIGVGIEPMQNLRSRRQDHSRTDRPLCRINVRHAANDRVHALVINRNPAQRELLAIVNASPRERYMRSMPAEFATISRSPSETEALAARLAAC